MRREAPDLGGIHIRNIGIWAMALSTSGTQRGGEISYQDGHRALLKQAREEKKPEKALKLSNEEGQQGPMQSAAVARLEGRLGESLA